MTPICKLKFKLLVVSFSNKHKYLAIITDLLINLIIKKEMINLTITT